MDRFDIFRVKALFCIELQPNPHAPGTTVLLKEVFMLIKDWMTTAVLTIDANTSVMRATRIMKENNIRRLPVLP